MQREPIVIIFNLRKILEDDSGGAERNFGVLLRSLGPVEDSFHVLLLHAEVVAVTDGTLQEDTDGVGQLGCTGEREG